MHQARCAMEDPSLERYFSPHKGPVGSLSVSPSSSHVASAGDDCTVVVHALGTGVQPRRALRFVGHQMAVTSVEWRPGGKQLVSASKDKTVRLWSASAKGDSTLLRGHSGGVNAATFSGDGRTLLTASDDKTLKVWSVRDFAFKASLVGHSNWVRCAALSVDARLAASGGDDRAVHVWDVERKTSVLVMDWHAAPIRAVCWHPHGPTCLATASDDRTVRIWDVRSGQLVQQYNAHAAAATGIAFHPSGDFLVSVGADKAAKVWDLREGHLAYTLLGHAKPLTAIAAAPHGQVFATAAADGNVFLWRCTLSVVDEDASSCAAQIASVDSQLQRPESFHRTAKERSPSAVGCSTYQAVDVTSHQAQPRTKSSKATGNYSASEDVLEEPLMARLLHIENTLSAVSARVGALESFVRSNASCRTTGTNSAADDVMHRANRSTCESYTGPHHANIDGDKKSDV